MQASPSGLQALATALKKRLRALGFWVYRLRGLVQGLYYMVHAGSRVRTLG